MSNDKLSITTIRKYDEGPIDGIDIIPDPLIGVTRKKTIANRIFINPQDYDAIKGWKPKTIINYLSLLTEQKL